MYHKKGLIDKIKKIIKRNIVENKSINNDIECKEEDIKIESIANITQSKIIKEKLEASIGSIENIKFELETIINTSNISENEDYVKNIEEENVEERIFEEKSIKEEGIENLRFERVNDSMADITIKGSNPCDIVNKLPQTILKIRKHLVNQEQLDNVGVNINLGHIDEYQILEVAFKYSQEIDNPCGNGTISGESLLKAVVLVGSINYSWVLYDKLTNQIVYDGEKDSITAYSVYDVIPFDEENVPSDVTAKFKTTVFERLEDNPSLDYYLYKIEGTVDIVSL